MQISGTMDTKKVTILGHKLDVVFNMAVEIEFEELSGSIFSIENLSSQKATMQLCFASMKIANKKLPFTYEEMLDRLSMKETAELKNAVIETMNKWFTVPEVMEKGAHTGSEEEGKN